MAVIQSIQARTIIDSRGHETLEVDVILDDGSLGRESVPSGASTGQHEVFKLEDPAKSRANALSLGQQIVGQDPTQQEKIDLILLQADGSEDKSTLGGNVLLALSLATAEAAAKAARKPLYEHLHDIAGLHAPIGLPTPMFNVINGGKHSDNNLPFQEFMLVPAADDRPFRDKVAIGRTLFAALKERLKGMGHTIAVGDEGGFAPRLNSNEEALEILVQTIEASPYKIGQDVTLAIDVAASAIPDLAPVTYPLDPHTYFERLTTNYPISILEDPLPEDDWNGWSRLAASIGSRLLVMGDDLTTTNPKRLRMAIDQRAINAIIIKPDQIGTLTETFQTMRLAEQAGIRCAISHRSGETESTFIADLAAGAGAPYIKTGALSRSERVAKYNQLLRIEERLGGVRD
ncbi:phosphopyruvate hydratase [Candidatus Berkelbacteria bacterium]|nr:phosphopyruvate hydratase [Candidatus Berkelbacteria bacterium]